MPLKFQSQWRLIITWLKARLGQVSGLALPRCFEGFCTLGHGMSLNKCPLRALVLLMTMLTDTQLIRGTWHYSECMWLPFWLVVFDRASERLGKWGKIKEMSVPTVRNNRYMLWLLHSKLYWSLKMLLSKSDEIISTILFYFIFFKWGFDWQ